MAANAAVVIPHHKENLTEFEKISLMQVQKVLGGKYPIIFAIPEGKFFDWIPQGYKIMQFPYLGQSVGAYNYLTKSKIFYEAFLEYEYILIYQLDAFVFSDKLEYFCSLGYDNIGAHWPWHWCNNMKKFRGYEKLPRVGNGGFCLRNVKAICKFIENHKDICEKYSDAAEDDFWAYVGVLEGSGFKAAPINIANAFSVEYFPERCMKKNGGELPFGCHGWYRFNADSYVKILKQCGYDFQPVKNQLNSIYLKIFQNFLINVAYQRLNRRINKGQSLTRYLPRKDFASVRVIRTPYTMLILARLLLENNSLSDKIFFYDENEQDILIQDLKAEKLPYLLLATEGGADTPIINILQQKGLAYGKRFVTFHREYLIACEKMFRKLGK